MLENRVVPKDRDRYKAMMGPEGLPERLQKAGSYTFAYSITDDRGDVRTKNVTVSLVEARLGRICLARADITDSVREQQSLLNVVAYTFELLGVIQVDIGRITLHTRQTVLENLPPLVVEDYHTSLEDIVGPYNLESGVWRRIRRVTTSYSPTAHKKACAISRSL